TTVYFNNPLWLQLLLSPMKEESRNWRPSLNVDTELLEHEETEVMGFNIPATAPEETNYNVPAEEIVIQESSVTEEAISEQKPETGSAPQHSEPLVQEIMDRLRGNIHESDNPEASASMPPPLPSERAAQEAAPADPVISEVLDRLREQIHQADIHEYPESETAAAIETVATDMPAPSSPVIEAEAIKTDYFSPVEAGTGQPVTESEQPAAETAKPAEAPVEEEPVSHEPVFFVHAPVEPGLPEPAAEVVVTEPVIAEPTEPAEIAIEGTQPQEDDLAPIPSLKVIIETPMAKNDMLFEPYHTIDYFASQGIRLDKLEPHPQDKLGRQLRSFTEWLKSMKKLPQASIEKALGENEESAVVAAATHSIEGKEVITEAMAEVFEKQGMRDRAIEIYRKLSLLNPSKSAYFADRINRLKYS
ncbi:MAG: hypothetical protein JST39_23735, partial [Bacteroidetes bacterium]|nr:hypothetical protein [Bacteroidota bacterium]